VEELLVLSVLGGLLVLDGTSLGQFMISRPVVAGTLTGWILGDPMLGFGLGALLEVYLLVEFPVGGARFPEGAPAAVIAVAAATVSPLPGAEALGVAVALIWGQLGALTVTRLRTFNQRLAPDEARAEVGARRVVVSQLLGILLDFCRGGVLTLTGVLVARGVVSAFASSWPLDASATRGLLLLGGVVSLGILLSGFGGLKRRSSLFATGAAAGVLLTWLL